MTSKVNRLNHYTFGPESKLIADALDEIIVECCGVDNEWSKKDISIQLQKVIQAIRTQEPK